MKPFLDENFLLQSECAQTLYHQHAAPAPIIDYHCHIDPAEIYHNRAFDNIAQVWLGENGFGDHYKWRLMRSCGVPEHLITGSGSDYDKFCAFAATMPRAIGSPVYHWAHLELRRYFDCELTLCPENANAIWELCNQKLKGLPVREIIRLSRVTHIVTTDDPLDDLRWHKAIAQDASFETAVLPGWRPDKALRIEAEGFVDYIRQLGTLCDVEISTMAQLYNALSERMDIFAAHGCRASDHGIARLVAEPATPAQLDDILNTRLAGGNITPQQADAFQYALLLFLGREYATRGWVMEIHYGARRNNNTRRFAELGPDTGYDAISPAIDVSGLPALLDALEYGALLPKTILFSLEPGDNAMLGTLCGCFPKEGTRGHVQQGAAWWFNDSKDGMAEQISLFARQSVLGNFVGMVTDSRSFLSYTRHEYFRRVLCNYIGSLVDAGEYPADMDTLGQLIQDICYNNARDFFGLTR